MNGNSNSDWSWDEILKLILKIINDCDRFSELLDGRIQDLLLRERTASSAGASTTAALDLSRQRAVTGARTIELFDLPNGRSRVVIDGVDSFVLTPRQADLLKLLVEDDGTSSDGFVAWKNRDSIRKRLGSGQAPMSTSALTSLVLRLREVIERESIFSGDLVHFSRVEGLRFALRR